MRLSCSEDGVVEAGQTRVATAASAVPSDSCRTAALGRSAERSEGLGIEPGMLRSPESRLGCRYMNKAHSPGPAVGHSRAWMVPSGSRSSVGA